MKSWVNFCFWFVIGASSTEIYNAETQESLVKNQYIRNENIPVSPTENRLKRDDNSTNDGPKQPLIREVDSDVKSALKYFPDVTETGRSLREMNKFALGFMDDIKIIRDDVAKIKKKTNIIYKNVTSSKKDLTKLSKAVKILTSLTNSSFDNLYINLKGDCNDVTNNYGYVAGNITNMRRQVDVMGDMWPTLEQWINKTVHHFYDLAMNQEQIKFEIQQSKLTIIERLDRLEDRLEMAFTGLHEDTKLIHERVINDILKVTNEISDLKKLITTTCRPVMGKASQKHTKFQFRPTVIDLIKYWPLIERIAYMIEQMKETNPTVGIGGTMGIGHIPNAPDFMKNLTGLFGAVAWLIMLPDHDIDIPWHLLGSPPTPIGTPRPATPELSDYWGYPLPNLSEIWDDIVANVDFDDLLDFNDYDEFTESPPAIPGLPIDLPEFIQPPIAPDWFPDLPITTIAPIIPELPLFPGIIGEHPKPDLIPGIPPVPDIYPTRPEAPTPMPTHPPSSDFTYLEPIIPFVDEPLIGYCPCICPCDCTCPILPIASSQKISKWWMRFHYFHQQKKNKLCECLCACPCPSSITTTEAPPMPWLPDNGKPPIDHHPQPTQDFHDDYDDVAYPAWDPVHSNEVPSSESEKCCDSSDGILREIKELRQDFNTLKLMVSDEMVTAREATLAQINAQFIEVINVLVAIHQANIILHGTDKNATEIVKNVVKKESTKTLYSLKHLNAAINKMNSAIENMLKKYYRQTMEVNRDPHDLYWPRNRPGRNNDRPIPTNISKNWFFGTRNKKK